MSRTHTTWLGGAALLAAVFFGGSAAVAADSAGWQIDLKYGQSTLEQSFVGRRTIAFDDESDAAGVEVGYRFNDYIGLQAGYHDLGTFQGTAPFCPNNDQACIAHLALFAPLPFEAQVLGWSLAAVPSWPFTDRLSAYGKVGLLDWETEMELIPVFHVIIAEFDTFSDTDLVTALGLRYRFRKNLGALIEYQRLDLDLDSTTVGVTWKF